MAAVAKKQSKNLGGFGARLRAFRKARGFTQGEMAKAAGVGRMTYIRFETGASEPTWTILLALATKLGVELTAFLDDPAP